jgi:hypothetical protein
MTDEVEQIIEPAAGIIGRPLVQLGLHPPYPQPRRNGIRPRLTGIHQRLRPLQYVACMNPLDPQGRLPARYSRMRALFRQPPTEPSMRLSPHSALQCPIPRTFAV